MSSTLGRVAAGVTIGLLVGLPAAAQSPAPALSWAEVAGTATCTVTSEGAESLGTVPVVLSGRVLACAESAGDPRVSGTSTTVLAAQSWTDGMPGAGVGWGDYTLAGPEGTWTGRHYDVNEASGVQLVITIATGDGAYQGLTYARSATIAADGSMELVGVIYTGDPPPDFPVTPSMGNPDEDLGPVPPVEEVTPAVTGTLKLGPAKGKATTATVGPAGGTIEITRRGDPLKGLTLTVPPGAYPADVALTISSRPIKGHDFGPLITPASPLITVETGDAYAGDLITVHIPAPIPDGSFGMAFLYDEASGGLEGLPLVDEDATGLTIATRHFSSFFVSVIELAALPPIVDSGFRPGLDDWQFTNFGSYLAPGGHCSGQSVSAMYYYLERQRKLGASHLHGLYDNNGDVATPDLWEDDSDGYRLASMVQHDSNWEGMVAKMLEGARDLPDRLHRAALRYAMAVTGEPQLLWLTGAGSGGHDIIAYRVTRDFIQVADPNYPGKHRAIRWDEATQDLRPYASGENMADIAASGVRAYTRVAYFAKSAAIDWEQIGRRWTEFDAGTIGDGTFPAFALEVQDAVGDWVPLVDGYHASGQQLTMRLRDPAARDDMELTIYPGTSATAIATAKDTGSEAKVTIDLADGENALGISLQGSPPSRPRYDYVDFVRLAVKPAPVGTMYTLYLRFDGGCDTSFDPSYSAWSRVQPLPVRVNKDKAFVDYTADFQEKHLAVTGVGTFDPRTGVLTLPSISASFTRDMVHENGTPLTGRETLIASVSGVIADDPAIEGQSFPLEATGSVDVRYPQRYPSAPTPDPDITCTASVTEARLDEGWVDGGL